MTPPVLDSEDGAMRTLFVLSTVWLILAPADAPGQESSDFPDLVYSIGGSTCLLYNNGGRFYGSYDPEVQQLEPMYCFSGDTAFGDINGDGRVDAITPGWGVLLGHGDGEFGVRTTAFVGPNFGMAIAAGDVNHDGYDDVLLGTLGARLYYGNPDGTLTPHGGILFPFQGGGFPPALHLIDLDADGDLDIWGRGAAGPLLAYNLGDNTFEQQAPSEFRYRYPQRATVSDLNADGLLDFVSVGSTPRMSIDDWQIAVFVYLGAGRHKLGEETVLDIPGLTSSFDSPSQGVTVGDVNRDGYPDIVSGAGLSKIAIFRGAGDGTFLEPPELVALPEADEPRALLLEDMDLDGHLDLVVGYRALAMRTYWGVPEGFVDFENSTNMHAVSPKRFDVLYGRRRFVRGDADRNGTVDPADALMILQQTFAGRQMRCGDASDADDSGFLQITDAVFLLQHLFAGGPAPPYPYPEAGGDTTRDHSRRGPRMISGDLGCSFETFWADQFFPCGNNRPEEQDRCKNPILQFLDVSVPGAAGQ